MYINEIVGEEYKIWDLGSEVYLKAATGTGKTTFILKTLLPYAVEQGREILYLTNRKILHQQLIKEICDTQGIPYSGMGDEFIAEFPGITFMTYQTLQEKLEKRERCDDFYFYIVADEVHYLVEDSSFNPKIQYLLEWLKSRKRNCFIAISATIQDVLSFLGFYEGKWIKSQESMRRTIYIRSPLNICNIISKKLENLYVYSAEAKKCTLQIFAYQDIQEVVDIINSENTDEKWLIFQSNKKKAKEIEKMLNCSKNFISAEIKEPIVIDEIIREKKFSNKVLISTKVLDNGISLEDGSLKNIVIETTSKTEFLQMFGRRRSVNSEQGILKLFLPIKSAEYFRTYCVKKIYPELKVMNTGVNELLCELLDSVEVYRICRKYFVLKEGELSINPIAKWILNKRKRFFEKMSESMKENENAFLQEQLDWLDNLVEVSQVIYLKDIETYHLKEDLKILMQNYSDKSLSKEEQKIFRESVKPILQKLIPKSFTHNDRIPSICVINQCLESLDMEYRVISKSGKKKGQETKWKVQKI